MESQWWPAKKLATQAFQRLRRVIIGAYESIPYYEKTFDRTGILPQQIRTPEDVALLPTLSKDDLRLHFSELKSTTALTQEARLARTSGSTGTPVQFYLARYVDEIEYAYLWRHWNWAGFNYGDRAVVIRGLRLEGTGDGNPPYKVDRENGRTNLYISSYHLNETNLHFYFQLMARFHPKIIRAYPSTLDILTRFAESFGHKVVSVQSIITASETLSDSVRDRAEGFWQCRIFDWYGQRERVAAIGQCECGNYHINEEYSYVELISLGDDLFEIVGSSFNNAVMPLLRYRTGDLARRLVHKCPCGRGLPALQRIEGRTSQMLLSTDGRWLFPSALQEVFESCSNIRMAQVIQKEQEYVEVRIVPANEFQEEERLRLSLKRLLGPDINLCFVYVSDIEPGRTGKRPLVVSHLPEPFS